MGSDHVLGVSIGFHDSSAALLRNGRLRWLVEQERVSLRKHAIASHRRTPSSRAFRPKGSPRTMSPPSGSAGTCVGRRSAATVGLRCRS